MCSHLPPLLMFWSWWIPMVRSCRFSTLSWGLCSCIRYHPVVRDRADVQLGTHDLGCILQPLCQESYDSTQTNVTPCSCGLFKPSRQSNFDEEILSQEDYSGKPFLEATKSGKGRPGPECLTLGKILHCDVQLKGWILLCWVKILCRSRFVLLFHNFQLVDLRLYLPA